MAKETLTSKILDNIAAGFADVQKDITEAKKAIEAAGVPSSGSTKNLSEEIAKIQTKVTDNIKESGNIEGFGGGTMDIKDGFVIRKIHNNVMNESTTTPLVNNIDYKVPGNMSYELTWPTVDAISKDMEDFYNLRNSEDEKIREKYLQYDKLLIRLHFQKNNTGRLANTGQHIELKPYDPDNNNWESRKPDYDLEVHLTDNTVSTSDKVSQELIDTYKLNNSNVSTNDNIIRYTGEHAMSLPAHDSKFFINGDEVSPSVIITDTFVAGIHPKIKATICKKIVLHNDSLIISRTRSWRDFRNMSTEGLDVYIDKDTETLEIDTDNLNQYIAKYPTMQYALIGPTSNHSMLNILVNKTDKMTASIKAVALKLATVKIHVFTYDRSEYFDFDRMMWTSAEGVFEAYSRTEIKSWPRFLSTRRVDANTIFYYNGWETDRYTLVNRFKFSDSRGSTNGLLLNMAYINNISQLEDIVKKAKDGYLYKVGTGEYMDSRNTITLESPDHTWKPNRRLAETSSIFPKLVRNIFSVPEVDGVKTVTLDLSSMPEATYGVQEFPLVGLAPEDGRILCNVVLSSSSGSKLANKDFELLAAPKSVKFLDNTKTPITSITVDRSSVTDDKFIIPIFYNKFITEVNLTGCTIGKVTGSDNGVFADFYDGKVPTNPIIFKLHNCRYGDVYNGPDKDRNPEIEPVLPYKADENAKFVRFLIDESDPILQDDNVFRLRLSFYNIDQTKKYNWTAKAWEALDAVTPDNKEYRYIVNPHLEEEEAARAAAEAANNSEETEEGHTEDSNTSEETHTEEN